MVVASARRLEDGGSNFTGEFLSDAEVCEMQEEAWPSQLGEWFGAQHSCECNGASDEEGVDVVETKCKATEQFCCPDTGRCHEARREHYNMKAKDVNRTTDQGGDWFWTSGVEANMYCYTYLGDDLPNGRVEICEDTDFDPDAPGNEWSCDMINNGEKCQECSQCEDDDATTNFDCSNIAGIEDIPADIFPKTGTCYRFNGAECASAFITKPLSVQATNGGDSGSTNAVLSGLCFVIAILIVFGKDV
jgi:hypothetical protein